MLNYGHSAERTDEYAAKAFRMMQLHAVPPSPRNFAVWYAHAAGAMPEMSKSIDAFIAAGDIYTEDLGTKWHQTLAGVAQAAVMAAEAAAAAAASTARKVETRIAEVMKYLDSATAGAKGYGKTLREAEGELGAAHGIDGLRDVIASLVQETRKMADHTMTLEQKLAKSSEQISELRNNLEMTQREAITDALTGLGNRKYFDRRLVEAAEEAQRAALALSLLMVDIDLFKRFNDSYGHQLGDQVLRLVAQTMVENLKGQDTAARYGGEEFAVLLPGTALDGAFAVAENIREAVQGKKIVRRSTGEVLGSVTLSIGAAQLRPGESLVETISRADAALYAAKRNGRNCTVLENSRESAQDVAD